MGGYIRTVLGKYFENKYNRRIFKINIFLTDGEGPNTKNAIELVSRNIKYSRVHTIGIGDGASQSLIKDCDEKGKGYHIFIKDNENPSEKDHSTVNRFFDSSYQ